MSDPLRRDDPNYDLVDSRIARALGKAIADGSLVHGGGGGYTGGMDDAWRTKVDGRLDGLERSVEGLKGSLDGLKIAASALTAMVGVAAAVLGGFVYFSTSSTSARIDRVEAKVDAIVPRITEEFRAMRLETAAQTSAIANSITATKQQAPQVILVPSPQIQPSVAPQQ